jgi:AraC-like DNA-binding protein
LAAAPTATGLATRLAIALLERRDVDPAPLLRQCRLSAEALAKRKRIDVASQLAFLELVARVTGDDFVGLTLAESFDLRELGMLYYVAASSHVLGDAITRLARYAGVGNEALVVRADNTGTCRIRLTYAGVPRHLDRHQVEMLSVAMLRLCRQITGQKLVPLGVDFVHHRSGDLRPMRRAFGCDVRFDCGADEIRFEPVVSGLRLIGDDPFLNEIMLRHCEDAVAARGSNAKSFRTTVENTIAPLLPHAEARAKAVARHLRLSERTFARRLAAEGLSFGVILDELRRDLAQRYLQEPHLQISQIAWLLGFQQPSAFSHACRRWLGSSPSEYRRAIAIRPAT